MYSRFFERPDLSNGHLKNKTGRKSFHFPLGPKFQLAGKDLKLYNLKSFCLTFFLEKLIFFSAHSARHGAPPFPAPQLTPPPPSPPPGT